MGRDYLIKAARLIDGRGEIQERPIIRIEDARITAVSIAQAMDASPEAEMIDASDAR